MRQVCPVPTSNHSKIQPFIQKDLDSCTHVFLRCDRVKAPLEPPYTGPHKVLERITDKLYRIEIEGVGHNISIERLKSGHTVRSDETMMENASDQRSQNSAPKNAKPLDSGKKTDKTVKFSTKTSKDTKGGVYVANPIPTSRNRHNQASDDATSRRQRRKQVLKPREIFSISRAS